MAIWTVRRVSVCLSVSVSVRVTRSWGIHSYLHTRTCTHTHTHIHTQVHRPEVNLVRTTAQDTAAHFVNLTVTELRELSGEQCHQCLLSFPTHAVVTEKEINDLWYHCNSRVVDHYAVVGYKVAHIMTVHFRAGEWPHHPRCGSVITCVISGRSLFARVKRFFKVLGEPEHLGYASVSWFSEPEYLYPDNPLGVRCKEDGSEIEGEVGSVIRITQIDPTQIMVEPEVDTDMYVMIRDAGYNTRPR